MPSAFVSKQHPSFLCNVQRISAPDWFPRMRSSVFDQLISRWFSGASLDTKVSTKLTSCSYSIRKRVSQTFRSRIGNWFCAMWANLIRHDERHMCIIRLSTKDVWNFSFLFFLPFLHLFLSLSSSPQIQAFYCLTICYPKLVITAQRYSSPLTSSTPHCWLSKEATQHSSSNWNLKGPSSTLEHGNVVHRTSVARKIKWWAKLSDLSSNASV